MVRKLNKETGELEEVAFTVPNTGIFWKTPFNHDTNTESDRTALHCADPSLTKQEFKEEVDINTIIARFLRTQELPPTPLPEHFTDVTGRTSYFDMSCRLAEANKIFYEQPAELRAEFLNDPARWADAVVSATEAKDGERLAELGIDVSQERKAANQAAETRLKEHAQAKAQGEQSPKPPAGTPAASSDKPAPKGPEKGPTGPT